MNAAVKPLAWIFGVVLLLVGIIGFFNDPVLEIFNVNGAHNWVHILSGIVGIICAAMGYMYARWYLIGFGIVYGLVTILGFLGVEPVVSLLEINDADNWLHLAIAAVCLIAGFGSKGASAAPAGVPNTPGM